MDKIRIVKRLENGNILTEKLGVDDTNGILYTPKSKREERYEKVKVVQVSETDVELTEGDILYIKLGSGTDVSLGEEGNEKDYTLVNRRDILLVK